MIKIEGKIERLGDTETHAGRMGEYQTQRVMLQVGGEGRNRQTVYGTMFGPAIEALQAMDAKAGDTIEVELVFTTSERNGFVTNCQVQVRKR